MAMEPEPEQEFWEAETCSGCFPSASAKIPLDKQPRYPCLPTCSSYWHQEFYREQESSFPFRNSQSPEKRRSPSIHKFPPIVPNSTDYPLRSSPSPSTMYDHHNIEQLKVPAGCFMSQGVISLKEPEDNFATVVFIPPPKEKDDYNGNRISGKTTPIPVCEDMLEQAKYTLSKAKIHVIEIIHRSDKTKDEVDIDHIDDIVDITNGIHQYHKRFQDIMMETERVTDSKYHFISDSNRTQYIPVPTAAGKQLPVVLQGLTGGKTLSSDEASCSHNLPPTKFISFGLKESQEKPLDAMDIPDPIFASKVLDAVIKSLEDPMHVATKKNDANMDYLIGSYMNVYRRMANTLNVAQVSVEDSKYNNIKENAMHVVDRLG